MSEGIGNMNSSSTGLIAIMGSTGTGKSSFINTIAGAEIARVGHGLESETSEIQQFDVKLPNGTNVTLVDTPGFNDFKAETGGKSDVAILREIAKFLTEKFHADRKFSGILYLHSICDSRVGNVSQRHMTMFAKLCGAESMKNVVVVTTFWDRVDLTAGIEKELQLQTNRGFLKQLKDGDAKFMRYGQFENGTTPEGGGFQTPLSLIYELLGLKTVFVALQEELAGGKPLNETAAGAQLNDELERLKLAHATELASLRNEIESVQQSYKSEMKARLGLEEECEALKLKLQLWEEEQTMLKEDLGPGIPVCNQRDELDAALGFERMGLISPIEKERLLLESQHAKECQWLEGELKAFRQAHAQDMRELKFHHATEVMGLKAELQNLQQIYTAELFSRDRLEEELGDLRKKYSLSSTDLEHLYSQRQQDVAEKINLLHDNKRLRAVNKRLEVERLKHIQESDDMRRRLVQLQLDLEVEKQARMKAESQAAARKVNKRPGFFPDGLQLQQEPYSAI